MNLTLETLDGLIKHNGPINDSSSLEKILGKNFFKNKIVVDAGCLEAQISAISDDIAYNNHDIQDAIIIILFNLNDLNNLYPLRYY